MDIVGISGAEDNSESIKAFFIKLHSALKVYAVKIIVKNERLF